MQDNQNNSTTAKPQLRYRSRCSSTVTRCAMYDGADMGLAGCSFFMSARYWGGEMLFNGKFSRESPCLFVMVVIEDNNSRN